MNACESYCARLKKKVASSQTLSDLQYQAAVMARFFNENEFHSFFSVLFPLKRNENETGQQENETKRNEKLRKRNGKPKRKFSNKSLKITEYQVECTSWSRSQRCPSLLISGKSSKFWSFLPFSGHNWFTYVGPSPRTNSLPCSGSRLERRKQPI